MSMHTYSLNHMSISVNNLKKIGLHLKGLPSEMLQISNE